MTLLRMSAVLVVTLLAACGGGRATPEDTLRSLRSAARTGADARVLELLDADSRAYYRQLVRTVRARVEAGEAPERVLPGSAESRAGYLEGGLEEAAAHAAVRTGHVAGLLSRVADSSVVATEIVDAGTGSARAVLRVRGVDGGEHDLLFLREPEGWALDAFRHYQESLGR